MGDDVVKAKRTTEYVVLVKTGTPDGPPDGDGVAPWHVVVSATATSARAAIEYAVGAGYGDDGWWVAVPARSWHPLEVETVTRRTVVG